MCFLFWEFALKKNAYIKNLQLMKIIGDFFMLFYRNLLTKNDYLKFSSSLLY
jgi:hypothetical protein